MANEQEKQEQTTQETTQTTTAPIAADMLSPAVQDAPSTQQASDPRDAEIARLKHRLEVEFAEEGRVRKANEKIAALQDEIARLKSENASIRQRRPSDFLSDEEKELLDDGQLAAIDKVVRGRVGEVSATQKAENDRLREELAQRDAAMVRTAKAQFNAEVERLAPGLAGAVSEHSAEWQKWVGSPRRAASVASAFANNDAATVVEFLQEFAQSKGIRANGDGIAARPSSSFSPAGGSHPVQSGGDTATYTLEQYNAEMRRASEDVNAGRITADEYRAIKKKFDTALNEGRVVPR